MPISKKALTEAIEKKLAQRCAYDDDLILAAAKAHAETLKDDGPTLKEIAENLDFGILRKEGVEYLARGADILSRLYKFREQFNKASAQGVAYAVALRFVGELP